MQIRGGNSGGAAPAGQGLNNAEIAAGEIGNDLFCGRFLQANAATLTDETICCKLDV